MLKQHLTYVEIVQVGFELQVVVFECRNDVVVNERGAEKTEPSELTMVSLSETA